MFLSRSSSWIVVAAVGLFLLAGCGKGFEVEKFNRLGPLKTNGQQVPQNPQVPVAQQPTAPVTTVTGLPTQGAQKGPDVSSVGSDKLPNTDADPENPAAVDPAKTQVKCDNGAGSAKCQLPYNEDAWKSQLLVRVQLANPQVAHGKTADSGLVEAQTQILANVLKAQASDNTKPEEIDGVADAQGAQLLKINMTVIFNVDGKSAQKLDSMPLVITAQDFLERKKFDVEVAPQFKDAVKIEVQTDLANKRLDITISDELKVGNDKKSVAIYHVSIEDYFKNFQLMEANVDDGNAFRPYLFSVNNDKNEKSKKASEAMADLFKAMGIGVEAAEVEKDAFKLCQNIEAATDVFVKKMRGIYDLSALAFPADKLSTDLAQATTCVQPAAPAPAADLPPAADPNAPATDGAAPAADDTTSGPAGAAKVKAEVLNGALIDAETGATTEIKLLGPSAPATGLQGPGTATAEFNATASTSENTKTEPSIFQSGYMGAQAIGRAVWNFFAGPSVATSDAKPVVLKLNSTPATVSAVPSATSTSGANAGNPAAKTDSKPIQRKVTKSATAPTKAPVVNPTHKNIGINKNIVGK